MALGTLKPCTLGRHLWSARRYSRRFVYRENEEDKSRYQRDEEGKKPRIIHGQEYPDWRQTWEERTGQYSMLKLFISDKNPSPDVLTSMQKIPELTVAKIKDWWSTMKEFHEIENQRFISERIEVLGANIGAAHFFLYRKATVRLRGSQNWLQGDPTTDEVQLPVRFQEGYHVEAIDTSTFHNGGIRYEGLANLANLNFLKWLSLKNNAHVNEWGLDRVAGQNGGTLEYLDVSGCSLGVNSVLALARMSVLKVLVVTEPTDIKMETALAALEADKPSLIVKTVPPT